MTEWVVKKRQARRLRKRKRTPVQRLEFPFIPYSRRNLMVQRKVKTGRLNLNPGNFAAGHIYGPEEFNKLLQPLYPSCNPSAVVDFKSPYGL